MINHDYKMLIIFISKQYMSKILYILLLKYILNWINSVGIIFQKTDYSFDCTHEMDKNVLHMSKLQSKNISEISL